MVGRLQDDCLSLGKLSATAVRRDINEEERGGSGFGGRAEAPSLQRSALLGGGGAVPTVRTFGAAPKGVETEETRPLDGGGLMHLQQTKINDQDSMLKQLSVCLLFPLVCSWLGSEETRRSLPFRCVLSSLSRPSSNVNRSSVKPSDRRSRNRTSCWTSWTRRSIGRERRWGRRRGRW